MVFCIRRIDAPAGGSVRRARAEENKTHVKEIDIFFEDEDPVAHTSQSVGGRQASGRASDDEEVKRNHGLVRLVWDC